MEIAPDLQFKHYTVSEAQLPGGRARLARPGDARGDRDLLRPRAARVLRGAHDPAVVEALREPPLVRPRASGRPSGPARLGRATRPVASGDDVASGCVLTHVGSRWPSRAAPSSRRAPCSRGPRTEWASVETTMRTPASTASRTSSPRRSSRSGSPLTSSATPGLERDLDHTLEVESVLGPVADDAARSGGDRQRT